MTLYFAVHLMSVIVKNIIYIFWPADPVMTVSKSFTADACFSTLTKNSILQVYFIKYTYSKVQVYF